MSGGIAVRGLDTAGGAHLAPGTDWYRVEGRAVVRRGDPVRPHGEGAHASSTMGEGAAWCRVGGAPVCRVGHKADCGHETSGRPWFRIG